MKKTLFLLLSLILFVSCKDLIENLFEDEAYTLTREDYTGKEIRTDGYYYHYYENRLDLVLVTIFYKNGVAIDGVVGSSLSKFEEHFSDGTFMKTIKIIKVIGECLK